jgi:hypothetical protein
MFRGLAKIKQQGQRLRIAQKGEATQKGMVGQQRGWEQTRGAAGRGDIQKLAPDGLCVDLGVE